MTVADHAERVCELMHIMGVTQATLVGHGMGAAIALHLRSMAPACATQVILVDPDLIAVAPAEPPESPGGRPAPHRCLSGRLRGRMRRIAMLEPVWRKLAPGWLASELHAAMLPAYALREVGVRALDSFLVNYRTREGREAVCAQLRALKRLPTTPTIVRPLSHESAITIASGMLASRRSQVCLTHLTDYLHQVTGTRVAIHQMAGVAHMAPEEAPDRLGSLISDVVRRQYKTESGVAILGDTATGIADVNSNNPPHSTQS
jgi:pimeloyl-ACP methyl ester carboxylesterase